MVELNFNVKITTNFIIILEKFNKIPFAALLFQFCYYSTRTMKFVLVTVQVFLLVIELV